MRTSLLLFAIGLAACGDAPDAVDPSSDAPARVEATSDAPAPSTAGALPTPTQAAAPPGSLGAFTLYYIQEETEDTTRVDAFLPPPMPLDAAASLTLDAVPSYRVALSTDGFPDGTTFQGTHYVYATIDEVGDLATEVLRGHVPFSRGLSGLFRGEAYAFTFPPLWGSPELDPTLTVQESGGEEVFGSATLPTLDGVPDWVYPLRLPTMPEGTEFDLEADVHADGIGLVLLYPKDFGDTPSWDAASVFEDRGETRRREREGITDLGTRYRIGASRLDRTRSEAYLIAVPL